LRKGKRILEADTKRLLDGREKGERKGAIVNRTFILLFRSVRKEKSQEGCAPIAQLWRGGPSVLVFPLEVVNFEGKKLAGEKRKKTTQRIWWKRLA